MKVQIKKLISSVLALAMTASLFTTSLVSAAPVLPGKEITEFKKSPIIVNNTDNEQAVYSANYADFYAETNYNQQTGAKVVVDLSTLEENPELIDEVTISTQFQIHGSEVVSTTTDGLLNVAGKTHKLKLVKSTLPAGVSFDALTPHTGDDRGNIFVEGAELNPKTASGDDAIDYSITFDTNYRNFNSFTATTEVTDWVVDILTDGDDTNNMLAFGLWFMPCDESAYDEGKPAKQEYKGRYSLVNGGLQSAKLTVTYIDDSVVKAQELADLQADIAAANYDAADAALVQIWGADDYYSNKFSDLSDKAAIYTAITNIDEYYKLFTEIKPAVLNAYNAQNTAIIADYRYSAGHGATADTSMSAFTHAIGNTSVSSRTADISTQYGSISGVKAVYDLTMVSENVEFIKAVRFQPQLQMWSYNVPAVPGDKESAVVLAAELPEGIDTLAEATADAIVMQDDIIEDGTSAGAKVDNLFIRNTQHTFTAADIEAMENIPAGSRPNLYMDYVDITADFVQKIRDGKEIAAYNFWILPQGGGNNPTWGYGYYNNNKYEVVVEYVTEAEFLENVKTTDNLPLYLAKIDEKAGTSVASAYAAITDADLKAAIDAGIASNNETTFEGLAAYINELIVNGPWLSLKAAAADNNSAEVATYLAAVAGPDNKYYADRYVDLTAEQQTAINAQIAAIDAIAEKQVTINGANYTTTEAYKLYSEIFPAIETAYQQGRTGIIDDVVYAFTGTDNLYKKRSNMLSWKTKYTNGTISSFDDHPYWVNEYGIIMGTKVFYDLSLVTKDTEFIKSVTVTPWVEPGEMKNGYIRAAGSEDGKYNFGGWDATTVGGAENVRIVSGNGDAGLKYADMEATNALITASEEYANDTNTIAQTKGVFTPELLNTIGTYVNNGFSGNGMGLSQKPRITFTAADITEDFIAKINAGYDIASYTYWLDNAPRGAIGSNNSYLGTHNLFGYDLTVQYVTEAEFLEDVKTADDVVPYINLVGGDELLAKYNYLTDDQKIAVNTAIAGHTETTSEGFKAFIENAIVNVYDEKLIADIKALIEAKDGEGLVPYVLDAFGPKSYTYLRYKDMDDKTEVIGALSNALDGMTYETFVATTKQAVADAMAARKSIKEAFVYESNITSNGVTNDSKAFYFTMKHNWGQNNVSATQSQMYTGEWNLVVGHKLLLDLTEIAADAEFIKYASIVPMIQAWGFNGGGDNRPEQLTEGEAVKGFVVPSNIPEGATYDSVLADYLVDKEPESGVLTNEYTQSSPDAIPTQHIATKEQAEAVEAKQSGVDMTMDVVDITADLKAKLESNTGVAAYNFWLAPGKEIPADFTGSLSDNCQYWSKILTNNDRYKVYIEYVTEEEFIENVKTSDNPAAYVKFVLTDNNLVVWENQVSAEAEAVILDAVKAHECETYAEFRTYVNNLVKAQRVADVSLSDINVIDSGYSVSITNNTADVKPMFVVAAAYGENNKMLASVIYSEEGNIVEEIAGNGNAGFTFAFDGVEGVEEIKVFCWADAATIKPYCDAKTYTVTQ